MEANLNFVTVPFCLGVFFFFFFVRSLWWNAKQINEVHRLENKQFCPNEISALKTRNACMLSLLCAFKCASSL